VLPLVRSLWGRSLGTQLEVADVLRRHGPTYRDVHADSLSREQYRVMTAIEQCRTAA
jgi:hypothetical protein